MKRVILLMLPLVMMVSSCCTVFGIGCPEVVEPVNKAQHTQTKKGIDKDTKSSDQATKNIDSDVGKTEATLPEEERETVQPFLDDIRVNTETIRGLNEEIRLKNVDYGELTVQAVQLQKDNRAKDKKIAEQEAQIKEQAKSKLLWGYTGAGFLAIILIGMGIYNARPKIAFAGIGMSLTAAGMSFWHDRIALVMGILFAAVFAYLVFIMWEKRQKRIADDAKDEEFKVKDETLKQVVGMVQHLKEKLPEGEKKEFFKKSHRAVHITNEKTREVIAKVKASL